VARQVAEILARRGWVGKFHPCANCRSSR
jgi:hypothetical protein